MEKVSTSIKDKFYRYTNYDIDAFFSMYLNLVDEHIGYIEDYYSGESYEKNEPSFSLLEEVKTEASKVMDMIELNTSVFTEYGFWVLKEQVENIISYTETVDNLPKYYRSVKVGDSYKPANQFKIIRKANQSLEIIQRDVAGSSDWENDWRQLAINNNLNEEGYTKAGGELISVEIQGSNQFRLTSIVGGIKNVKDIYGVDIDKNIAIIDSDLAILNNDDTLSQTVSILMDKGIDSRELLGDTFASFAYPILVRQIMDIFSTDDSFAFIKVVDLRRVDESIYMDLEIETKAGDSISSTFTV